MKQLGLDLDVKVDDYNRVYFPEVFSKGNFKGMVYGLQSGYQDIDGIIYNMLHPNGTRNHSKLNMPGGTLFQDGGRLTQMVEAQRVETDETKRRGIIHDIQRYLSEQMAYVPAVTTGNFSTFGMSWPWLRNARVYRSVTYAQASEVWAHYWIDEQKRKELGG
jgi:ABC-type transport system substrate-binding protein